MNNYRRQDACVNCLHLGRRMENYEEILSCERKEFPQPDVQENGICDDYEKKLVIEKPSCVITNKTHECPDKDSA